MCTVVLVGSDGQSRLWTVQHGPGQAQVCFDRAASAIGKAATDRLSPAGFVVQSKEHTKDVPAPQESVDTRRRPLVVVQCSIAAVLLAAMVALLHAGDASVLRQAMQ